MRIRTIWLIGTLALGLLAGPLPAEAQQPRKVPLIGFLYPGSGDSRLALLREGLRELGYVDGQNIVIQGARGTVPEENRELFVLQKENGSWKIDRYMFNKMK